MNLDKYQKEAVENEDKKVLLVAPPGSGKTTVLIEKIVHLIEKRGYIKERIMVLTFSRSASENIKERVKRRFITGPFFGTIHSLAYRVLMKRNKRKIILPFQALEIVKGYTRKYGLNEDETFSALGRLSLLRSEKEISNEGYSKEFLKGLDRIYKEGKGKDYMDFDDLMDEFLIFLDSEEGENIKNAFDFILVDEFQDLDEIQLKILNKLSKKAYLFCVGDEDQCIYSFRGASSLSMVNFKDYFSEGIKLYLKYNYRSKKSIIDYANDIIKCNKIRNPKKIETFSEEEGDLKLYVENKIGDNNRVILDIIRKTKDYKTVALLYRTNNEMMEVMELLFKNNIGFSILDKKFNFFNKDIYKDLICYFKGSYDIKSFKRSVEISLKKEIDGKSIRALDLLNNLSDREIKNKVENKGSSYLLIDFRKRLENLRDKSPNVAIDRVFYILGYYDYLKHRSLKEEKEMSKYLEDINDFKEKVKSFYTVSEMTSFIEKYSEIMEERNIEMERIVLGTMHSVKGMEFNKVIIMNLLEGYLPHEKSLDDIESERRLWYVAVTRAMEDLYIMIPKVKDGEVSRFLTEVPYTNKLLTLDN